MNLSNYVIALSVETLIINSLIVVILWFCSVCIRRQTKTDLSFYAIPWPIFSRGPE